MLHDLQQIFDLTHTGAWTSDRGCSIHGVPGLNPKCNKDCATLHPAHVPNKYRLVEIEWNDNAAEWNEYVKARGEIIHDCKSKHGMPWYKELAPVCSDPTTSKMHKLGEALGAPPLVAGCNEWRLWHGAPQAACEGICKENFKVSLAGTGGTPVKPGRSKGRPLYGQGAYFAESVTKADEYARPSAATAGRCHVLVCRVIGGKVMYNPSTDGKDPCSIYNDTSQVQKTGHHSVVGQRPTCREFIVYDKVQIFPEFMLTYQRV